MRTAANSRRLLSCLTAFTASQLLLAAEPVPTHAPVLLAANQYAHTLSIIDPIAGKQIALIDDNGVTGHEVTASPDGTTAYLPLYGSSGVGAPGTDGQTMDVIDIGSHKIIHTFDFGHPVRPHKPIYNTHDNLLYVSTELDKAITIIDPKSLKVVGTIPTGAEQSHMFVLSHDGRFAYTSNVGPGSISFLDVKARKLITVLPIATHTQRIAISNDDKYIFASDTQSPRLAVIDTATRSIKTWIDLPASGYGAASTIDGKSLLIACPKAGKVAIIDLKTFKVTNTVDVPSTPQEILVRPDNKIAYVSNFQQVIAIDIANAKVDKIIDSGKGADGLAWAQ